MQKIKLELKDRPLQPLMKKRSLLITPKKIILFLFVLFLVLVVLYFWKEICFLIKPPALGVFQPPMDITVNQDKFEIVGKTTPFAHLTLNGEEIYSPIVYLSHKKYLEKAYKILELSGIPFVKKSRVRYPGDK